MERFIKTWFLIRSSLMLRMVSDNDFPTEMQFLKPNDGWVNLCGGAITEPREWR